MGNCFEETMTLKFPDLMKKINHIRKSSMNRKHRKENHSEAPRGKLPQSSDKRTPWRQPEAGGPVIRGGGGAKVRLR